MAGATATGSRISQEQVARKVGSRLKPSRRLAPAVNLLILEQFVKPHEDLASRFGLR